MSYWHRPCCTEDVSFCFDVYLFNILTVIVALSVWIYSDMSFETVLTGPMFFSKTVPTIPVRLTAIVLAVRKTVLTGPDIYY
jgi:hypothetical protein